MSNISLFKSGSVIPDYLRGSSDEATKAIAGSSGGKSISIKGGVWRMIVGGEEVARNEERNMNFVVIASGKGVTRTFYAEQYQEGKDIKPSCWSAEGLVPNEEVPTPQAKRCDQCPQNVEGSGDGKSRACRYSKRLAVTLENDISGNVYRLSVPAKSYFGRADSDKMPLQAYGKFLSGHGIPITGVVTEARFDTSEAVPVMKFRALRPLTQAEWDTAKAQSNTEDSRQAVDFRMVIKESNTQVSPQTFKEVPTAVVGTVSVDVEDAEEIEAPVKRAKAKVAVEAPKSVDSILDEWATDDE